MLLDLNVLTIASNLKIILCKSRIAPTFHQIIVIDLWILTATVIFLVIVALRVSLIDIIFQILFSILIEHGDTIMGFFLALRQIGFAT